MKGLGLPLLLLILFIGQYDKLVDATDPECGSHEGRELYCHGDECCGISGKCGITANECAPHNCQIGYGHCWDHPPPPPPSPPPHPSPPPPHPSPPPPPHPSPPPPPPSPPPPSPSPPPPPPSPPPPPPSPPPPPPSPPPPPPSPPPPPPSPPPPPPSPPPPPPSPPPPPPSPPPPPPSPSPPPPSPPPPPPSPPPPFPEYCGSEHGNRVCQDPLACCGTAGTCGYTFHECSVGHCQPGFGECYDWPKPALCGPENHYSSCTNATNSCCSVYGECGNHYLQCGGNFCNPKFGNCTNPPIPDPPQKCGLDHGKCPSGECCSVYDKCGTGHFHCSPDFCQQGYGRCDDASSTTSLGVAAAFTSSPKMKGRFHAGRKTAFVKY